VKGQRHRVIEWQQMQSKLTFARRGSACRYDCIFLKLLSKFFLKSLTQKQD